MKGLPSIFRERSRELTFGFATNLLSAFGQSYLVSLFLLSLVAAAGISQGMFGLFYSGATLAAALILPFFGRWMDRAGERVAFIAAGLGLLTSLLLLSNTASWWMLVLALFGLRAFGQGAMTLLSAASVACRFESKRGLALGLTNLGFPAAEMILPSLTILAISLMGWRGTVLMYGLLLVVIMLGMHIWVLSFAKVPATAVPPVRTEGKARRLQPFRWWRDRFFFVVTASSIVMPFGGTIMLLYLAPISQDKGWGLDWMGAGFVAFAVVRAATSLLVGPLIDRFGALPVFPWTVGPFCFSVGILFLAPNPWVGLGFFLFLGLGFGTGTVLTALLAETYGNERLGEIRSISSSATIFSTALGPLATGLAIDAGISFDAVLGGLLVLSLLAWGAAWSVPWMKPRKEISENRPT